MCGLAGIFITKNLSPNSGEDLDRSLDTMCAYMVPRGPDASGKWVDKKNEIYLGHQRLSIQDLNTRSNQPMSSQNGKFHIVFNGEIYNFKRLKGLLRSKGVSFQTNSDTEVLLCMYQCYGEDMLSKLRGMFAFAIWDSEKQELFMARDPYGIKPLYYSYVNNKFLFASQVKALLSSGLVSNELSGFGQAGFWLFGAVPEPYTWFKNIRSFPAGSFCKISVSNPSLAFKRFMSVENAWNDLDRKLQIPKKDPQDAVRDHVRQSVDAHMVSDVPVAIFLSGGVDSSSLAGIIKDLGHRSITGITLKFEEFLSKDEDEVPFAREVAHLNGINHFVRIVTYQEFRQDLPKILAAMDQPTVDGINTWFASKACAELGLKVAISGLGGDELFCGYDSFVQIPYLMKVGAITKLAPRAKILANLLSTAISRFTRNTRLLNIFEYSQSLKGAYWLRRGLFSPNELVNLMPHTLIDGKKNSYDPVDFIPLDEANLKKNTNLVAISQLETIMYLRNQLLRDTDWASMAHGVEIRVPLVDQRLLSHLAPLSDCFKQNNGKQLLSKVPQQSLSKSLMSKKKTGFSVPLGIWLPEACKDLGYLSIINSSLKGSGPIQTGLISKQFAILAADLVYKKTDA